MDVRKKTYERSTHTLLNHTTTGRDRSAILSSQSFRTFNLLSEYFIDDVVLHYLDLLSEDQRFESAIFWTFIHDHLANDGTRYYCQYMESCIIIGFRMAYLHLMLYNCKVQGQDHFDSEYLGNGDR